MPISVPVTPNQSSKYRVGGAAAGAAMRGTADHQTSTHEELLENMDAFRQRTLATPGAARQFLIDAGLLTKAGKPKQLIRD